MQTALDGTLPIRTSETCAKTGRDLGWATTVAVLIIGFLLPIARIDGPLYSVLHRFGISRGVEWGLAHTLDRALIIALVCFTVLKLERQPLSSIGLGKLAWSDLPLGFAIFAAVEISIYSAQLLVRALHPAGRGFTDPCTCFGVPLALMVTVGIGNGFSEEIIARGYAIERLTPWLGRTLFAATVALVGDVLLHVPGWGWWGALVIAPGQLVFVLAYLWRRQLNPLIIAHIFDDVAYYVIRGGWPLIFLLQGPAAYHYAAGRMQYQGGRYDAAIEELGRSIAARPQYGNAFWVRAEAYYMRGEYQRAIDDYSQAISLVPKTSSLYIDRANAYRALKNYPAASADFDEAVRTDPFSTKPLEKRAEFEAALEHYDAALADFDKAISLEPKNSHLVKWHGYVYLEKHDYDHALADLGKAIALNPSDEQTLNYRAQAYIGKGDYQHALGDLDRAVRLAPEDDSIYRWRGYVHLARHDYDRAISDLSRPMTPASPDARSLIYRAQAYEGKADYRRAASDYSAATKLATDQDYWTFNSYAWFLATCPVKEMRSGKKAVEYATRACQASSWKNPDVIDTLAAAYAEMGEFDRATELQEKAIHMAESQSGSQISDMRERLVLYQNHKPCHEAIGSQPHKKESASR